MGGGDCLPLMVPHCLGFAQFQATCPKTTFIPLYMIFLCASYDIVCKAQVFISNQNSNSLVSNFPLKVKTIFSFSKYMEERVKICF